MAVENSYITQVINIPAVELNFECRGESGKSNFMKIYDDVPEKSKTNIKVTYAKDESLTFLVSGEQNEVLETRRDIIKTFQTQTTKQICIPKEHHGWIFGAQVQRWKELEKATATRIQIPYVHVQSDVIVITGTKEGIEKAEIALKSLSEERANEVTDEIVLPSKYCDSLKRSGRKQIQSIIADCGDVTITFPTAESDSDKVSIKGQKDNVEKAKQRLLELSDKIVLSSFSAKVRAKVQSQKFIIGKNGANIKKISESTGAQIIFPSEKDEDKEVITIIGKEDAVDKAKAVLESTIEKILRSQFPSTYDEDRTETEISIESKYHYHFLQRRGEVLHKIIEECGDVLISFPHTSAEGDRVVIKGALESVSAAKKRLLDIVHELESVVTIECEIPRKHRPVVMGTKGCKVRSINAEFNVQIRFPDRSPLDEQRSDKRSTDEEGDAVETVPDYDVVRITGQPDNAEAAKQALLGLVPFSIRVDVPNDLHCFIIGHRGRDVKALMEKYDVHIVLPRRDQNLDYVTITGTPSRVNEAKEAILAKCRDVEAERQEKLLKSYRLKIEVDSEYHPKIIGHSGTVIKKIISDNDVAISFPRIGDSEDNIVTISGYKENVHRARDDVMKIVDELDQMRTLVFGKISDNEEVSPCDKPNPPIHADIISCESNNVEKGSQDLSKIQKEFDSNLIERRNEKIEEVETEMQKLREKLNFSCKSMSLIQEQTDIITEALKYCEDIRKRLTELYNDEILRQESRTKELRDQLNDQVSTNNVREVEHAQLIRKMNIEREKCDKMIDENNKKYNQETTKLSDTIKDLESKLNAEREDKAKLIAKNDESSKRFDELLANHKALQVTSSEHLREREYLKSAIKELEEDRKWLGNELVSLKRARQAVIADENCKSIDITRLETASKTKDDEISKLKMDLSDALENNEDLSDIIQSLNTELISKEEEICQAKMDFAHFKANVDEHVLKEKANHEFKLQKIKSNVFDLKKKLVEITQDIHNSSEICETMNDGRNPSSSGSDKAEA